MYFGLPIMWYVNARTGCLDFITYAELDRLTRRLPEDEYPSEPFEA
jgi:hypothetical protein